jgi:hypothetical protein
MNKTFIMKLGCGCSMTWIILWNSILRSKDVIDQVEVFPKCRPKEQTRLYRKQFVRCGLRFLRVFLGQSGMVERRGSGQMCGLKDMVL